MKTNLHNLCDGKTRTVRIYVEKLEEPTGFGIKESNNFKETKKKALNRGLSANEMLDIIGFNPTGVDRIMLGEPSP